MLLSTRTSLILMGTVVALVLFAAPASAATHEVQPGESIQAAIDAAQPGDTIHVAAGVYHENLTITTDGIELRGDGASDSGTVLMPAATATPSECTDPTTSAVNGICVPGETDPQTGEPGRPVRGVTIEGFLVDGFSGSGVFAFVAHEFTVNDTEARNNAGYGISGFALNDVRFKDSVARDNGEPGFYVGDSPDADAELIGNSAIHNGVGTEEGFGFFLRDSSDGVVKETKHNFASGNSGAGPSGTDGGPATSGTGILLGGTHNVTVKRNGVFNNTPSLESPFSGGIVVASTTALGGADPTDNTVKKNVARGNLPADIVWDGTGQGNVFNDNRCGSSNPDGLCE